MARLVNRLDSQSENLEETHRVISDLILSGKPFLVGRPGGTESEGIYAYVNYRLGSRSRHRREYPRWFRENARLHSAITAQTAEEFDRFCHVYLSAILSSDVLAYGHFAPGSLGLTREARVSGKPITRFENLDPLTAVDAGHTPWSLALEDKKVLIVSPFQASIPAQLKKRGSVTGVSRLLPKFSAEVVTPPWAFQGSESGATWHKYLEDLTERALARTFDIAIIGASSFGLPLGARIKEAGKQAIHLGGTTQLLFGIRGHRWENHPVFSKYFDNTWVRPSAEERPPGREKIEGGAYW